MKELDPPIKIEQEVQIPVRTEKVKIASKPLKRGMIQWEFNLETHEGKPVEYKDSRVSFSNVNQVRHEIEYRTDRYYCMAINLNNATRKYMKWLAVNERVKLLMTIKSLTAPVPKPE